MFKNGCGQSGLWLYLQNEQMKLMIFLHAGTNSRKLEDQRKMGLASLVTRPKINRWNNRFFACWYKFNKAKS